MIEGRTTTIQSRGLSSRVRAGLDVARASAAIYVVLHHTLTIEGPASILFRFGQEAVLVFFLLSGFVIFANEKDRVAHPRGYYLRRLRRIYPTLLAAMAISSALWALGLISAEPNARDLAGTLLSVQDIGFLKPGVWAEPFLGNDPLWSLSYEVFFYAVFPLVMIAWRRSEAITRWTVGPLAAVAYTTYIVAPNHISLVTAYFAMWWAGAMAAHLYIRGTLAFRAAVPELAGLTALALAMLSALVLEGWNGIGYYPVLMIRHLAMVAILMVILISPLRTLVGQASVLLSRPASTLAALSYGLYVVHYPLLVQTGFNTSWYVVPAVAATLVVAWLADRGLALVLPKAPRD